MAIPLPSKFLEDDDRSLHVAHDESSLDAGNKPQQTLNVVHRGLIRAPSPDPSFISINDIQFDPDPDYVAVQHGRRDALPATAKGLKGKIQSFWIRNKGLALVLLAQFFGTLMNVTIRLLESEGNDGKSYHPFQILFVRMLITVFFASLYMWYTKTEHFPFGMKGIRLLLVARGICGFFGVSGMYYSLQYLPLSDATVITFLAPSLACWACSFIIKEPFTRMEQIAAYISLFGVVLIARPASLFAALSHHDMTPTSPSSGGPDLLVPHNSTVPSINQHGSDDIATSSQRAKSVGIAMLGVLGSAGAFTTLRWIGQRAHPLITVNYFSFLCTMVTLVAMVAVPEIGIVFPKGMKDWSYLIFLGVCGFIMQILLATGLAYEKSSRATNMVYMQMIFALSFDKLVFGTTPGALSIVGSSLILGSAIYVALNKEDPSKKKVGSRERGDIDEEQGLMEGDANAEQGEEANADIPLRSMR